MEIIKSVSKVAARILSSEPPSTREIAFVYQNGEGLLREVMNGEQISRFELRGKRYSTRYSIYMKNHFYRHEGEYPSMDPGRNFLMSVQFNVSVNSPEKVVQFDISNIQTYLDDNMPYWINPIVRDYAIEDFREVQQLVKGISRYANLVKDIEERGFKVDQIQVSVDLSKRDLEHIKQIEEKKRQKQLTMVDIMNQEEINRLQSNIEKKRREENWEENKKLLDQLENEGLDSTVLKTTDPSNLQKLIEEEYREKKAIQKKIIDISIEKSDFNDPDTIRKYEGLFSEKKSSLLKITLEQSPKEHLAWGGTTTKADNKISASSKQSDKDWVDTDG